MKADTFTKRIKLPEPIVLKNDLDKDIVLSKAELISIETMIEMFERHFNQYKMSKGFLIGVAPVSERISLDFALYAIPSDLPNELGEHCVYLTTVKNKAKVSTK